MIPLFKVFMASEAPAAVSEVLLSGYVGQGPKVDQLEQELKKVLKYDADLLTVSSCTAALDLALHLVGIKPGDKVVTTAQTCTATNTMIVNRGAQIVWADVNRRTGLIDPDSAVERALETGAKAIMAVDWSGSVCDYEKLREAGVPVIEDAAHAFMSTSRDAPLAGDYVCWSFQAIKHLNTGDGGLIKVPEDQTDRARLLRWFGLDRRSSASFRCSQNIGEAGYKYHMNDIAAAIGLANLPYMSCVVAGHKDNAAFYHNALKDLRGVQLPEPDNYSSWWLYTILVERRDEFEVFMKQRGIDVSQVHARNDKHDAFQRAAVHMQPLPGLNYFSAHQVSIPVGWWLTTEQRNQVVDGVVAWSKKL